MNKIITTLVALESAGIPLERQTQVLSLALAKTLAFACSLPATATSEAHAEFFKRHHEQKIHEVLAKINERTVIDIDVVCAQTLELWSLRYLIAYCPSHKIAREFFDLVGTKLGVPAVAQLSEYDQSALMTLSRNLASAVAPDFVSPAEQDISEQVQVDQVVEDAAPVEGEAPKEV